MNTHHISTASIDRAMAGAEYDKSADDSFAGRIDSCTGVVVFGATLKECQALLRSTLVDWILVDLKPATVSP